MAGKIKTWVKEHVAISLSLAANVVLTAGIVWQAHQIALLKALAFKLWFILQMLSQGQVQ